MIGNECQHECQKCGGIESHWPSCGDGYFGLCSSCKREGYMIVCCEVCDEWKPSKRGLTCEDCGKVRIVA